MSKHKQLIQFIQAHTPDLKEFKMLTDAHTLKVPSQLKNEQEEQLLHTAFTYLFQLNVARETHASLDVSHFLATEGNRLIKEKHPLNLIYDFQYTTAKTRMDRYVYSEPYTVPYNQMAAKIYEACFLFARLAHVAQTNEAPETLDLMFYSPAEQSFLEEFERLDDLALMSIVDGLTPADTVRIHKGTDAQFILNDTLVETVTAERIPNKSEVVGKMVHQFFQHQAEARTKTSPSTSPFHKVALYHARYGEMETLDLKAYYGEQLDDLVLEYEKYLY